MIYSVILTVMRGAKAEAWLHMLPRRSLQPLYVVRHERRTNDETEDVDKRCGEGDNQLSRLTRSRHDACVATCMARHRTEDNQTYVAGLRSARDGPSSAVASAVKLAVFIVAWLLVVRCPIDACAALTYVT